MKQIRKVKVSTAKAERKAKVVKVAKVVLQSLAVTGMVASVLVFPGLAIMYKWLDELGRGDRVANRRAFRRLVKRGMVRVQSGPRGMRLVLTGKGRKQIQRDRLRNFSITQPSVWDGRWRLVMFDLPESKHSSRDLLRSKLQALGFISLQKSVFVHPYPCRELIELLRGHYSLDPGQLYVFDAFVQEGEAILKKHFKLA